MLRDAIVAFFTLAVVGIGKFGFDAIVGLSRGYREVVMAGLIASLVGLVFALLMAIGLGIWLVRDDNTRKRDLEHRHQEILDAIKSIGVRQDETEGSIRK